MGEKLLPARAGNGSRSRILVSLLGALIAAALAFCLTASSAHATTPGVNTHVPMNVAYSSATLSGDVDPNGEATTTYFEYGTTVAYGSKTAEVGVGSGSTAINVSKGVTGLTPNAEYHYRIVAVNASGESKGVDKTFRLGWTTQTPASSGSEARFADVSCSSASDCIAVGAGTAQRWNGSEWKEQAPPSYKGGGIDLRGVSCASSTACIAVGVGSGDAVALSWNGSEWKVLTIPVAAATAILEDVDCSSVSTCTAVGMNGSSTLAMRWNGSSWSVQATPSPSGTLFLTAVSCPTSTFCMATGYHYESSLNPWKPFSIRWNDPNWTLDAGQKPEGATLSWFFGVSCVSETNCTAAGDKEINAGTHEHETMIQRWTGSKWELQSSPNPASDNLRVDDVSCVSASDCTAIGSYYTSAAETEQPMGLRWDGSTWALQSPPLPAGSKRAIPLGISCVAGRGCAAAGWYRNASSVFVRLAQANWRAAKPTTTTKAASGVAETTATLNGDVNPNGSSTKGYFEYGTTTAYGTKTAELSIGSGTSAVEKSQALSGLSPNTTYHYRFVANNENPETSFGSDQTLTTIGPPQVTTGTGEPNPASGEAATLNATVDPNGQSTTYQFEYGTSSGVYTTSVPIPAESVGSGMSGVPVSEEITGLTRGKTYYFRVTATNASGKVNGSEKSFTTQNVPGATTGSATKIGKTGATLNGFVTPNGLETKYQFEYGLTTSYGSKAPVPPKGPATGAVEQAISGLEGKTLYHYRLVAVNALGTTYGADKTFTTLPKVKLKAGSLLSVGAPIKAFSSNAVFAGITCGETEFSGTVSENPGAMQAISTAKAAKCTYAGVPFTFSIPTKGMTLEYGTDASGSIGNAVVSKFNLAGTWALGSCEYEIQLAGMYLFTLPTQLELTGEAKFVKGAFTCPTGGSTAGKFTITSGGTAVVAET